MYYADILVSGITQDIVNTGTVQVFLESSFQSGVWLNLPYIEPITSTVQAIHNFSYGLGGVRVYKFNSNGTNPTHPGTRKIKVVVIAGEFIKNHPEVNLADFSQLEKFIK